jgi:hypothetical protein
VSVYTAKGAPASAAAAPAAMDAVKPVAASSAAGK